MDPKVKKIEVEEIKPKTENLSETESNSKDTFFDLWDNFSGTHFI